MKRLLNLFAVLAVALSLGACASLDPGGTSVLKGGTSITAPIANPVTPKNIHQVKLVFAATQDGVLLYQQECFGSDTRPYPVTVAKIKSDPVLAVACKHRVSRYNAMKAAEDKAYNAIRVAEDFIARNPSGNGATYISAAWKSVSDYRARIGG